MSGFYGERHFWLTLRISGNTALRMLSAGLLFVGFLSVFAAAPRVAQACASCACGDPTLTVMGTEKPFQGRLRASLGVRLRSFASGEPGVNEIQVSEQRLDLGFAFAPLDWLFLSAAIPVARRAVTYANLAEDRLFSLSDVELRAKAFVFQDREFNPRHLISVQAGLELPTAPMQVSATGEQLQFEAQLGSGSFDPIVGLSYSAFFNPVSLFVSSTLIVGTPGRFDAKPGTTLLGTVSGQYQPWPELAFRLSTDVRWDEAFEIQGVPDPNSGGFALFISPEVVVSPVTDLLFRVAVQIPTVLALNGTQDEGPMVTLGVMYDL